MISQHNMRLMFSKLLVSLHYGSTKYLDKPGMRVRKAAKVFGSFSCGDIDWIEVDLYNCLENQIPLVNHMITWSCGHHDGDNDGY